MYWTEKITVFNMIGTNIRDRLDSYRRQKYREQMTKSIKNIIKKIILPWNGNKSDENILAITPSDIKDNQDMESTYSDDTEHQSQCTILRIVTYLLYFLLWATLYIIAIEYEFGAIYFIVSTLIFICLNTRSRPKKPGELSAYSVFNPNCKAIEGTLDASQFEREIRYGIGNIH
ncbi:uncharacterized protein LOC107994396 [Apis cerana]|uniref:uncharacterized protein LOC107994396 n=1 Tax=Apis cerana TaxID=7461 RepID=UPI0007E2AE5F|nr:uncharacterized protein LOC107994396 [Apis cerana]